APDTSSAILGKLQENEKVKIMALQGDWYQIEPVPQSYGWIHKSFVKKAAKDQIKLSRKAVIVNDKITVEGTVRPKVFTRVAAYKLITEGDKVYLLKGNDPELKSLVNRKVRINGTLTDPSKQKYPIVQIDKIEALD
ncbi:MAG TPA: SH3 domain-containing protein, partial [Candidatus Margulisiibacteriota bacterium]|nr:SH3 domain-containing protein [Candidatus Margulisiibacteriota bacterium]